jgi:Leucine-rich repeat (LRR) protein
LTNNDIRELPESLCTSLPHLKVLKLNRNDLKAIPKNVELLNASLKELHLQLNHIHSWPALVNRFSNLEVLDLGWNSMNKLVLKDQGWNLTGFLYPTSPGTWPIQQSLKSLSLKCNELSGFPYKICDFSNLKDLCLSQTDIEEVPDVVNRLSMLETLQIDGCKLTTFPKAVCSLINLKVLDISKNKINKLPSASTEMKNLVNLEEFYANDCQLTGWSQLYCQAKLRILHLSGNNILGFPTETKTLSMLKELKLNKNRISHIPEHITHAYQQLQILDLSENQITEIDDNFGRLSNLRHLNLSKNQITELPVHSMRDLVKLETLDISNNQIEVMFDWDRVQQLRQVKANDNLIRSFPRGIIDNIYIQQSLTSIDFTNNRLSEIPPDFYYLKGLKSCRLKHNVIDSLNDKLIGQLESLVDFNLDNNEIKQIPLEIIQLKQLKKLYVSYNSESLNVPMEVLNWFSTNQIEFTNLFETASKIAKGLYLGSANAATNRSLLKDYGVTHVLTIANDIPPRHTEHFKYMVIYTDDVRSASLKQHFKEAYNFIKEGMEQGGAIVHCMAGVSRSATIVTAFIMQNNNLRVGKAFAIVGKARPQVKPNDTFKRELQEFDKEIFDNIQPATLKKKNRVMYLDPTSGDKTLYLEDGKTVNSRISRLLDEERKQQQRRLSNSTTITTSVTSATTTSTTAIAIDQQQQPAVSQQQQSVTIEEYSSDEHEATDDANVEEVSSSLEDKNSRGIETTTTTTTTINHELTEYDEEEEEEDQQDNQQHQHQQYQQRSRKRMGLHMVSPLNFASTTSESHDDLKHIQEYIRERRATNSNATNDLN